jgi:biotin transport system substrate-specific component
MTTPVAPRPSGQVGARRSSQATVFVPRTRIPLVWPMTLVAGAGVVALAAQVAVPVPGSVVPLTLQGIAVLLVGGLFGSAIGAGSLVLYLLAGAFGAPVFAPGGAPGLARFLGPTGGYLLAFPFAAALVGRIAERRDIGRCLLGSFTGMAVIHLGGWAQLAVLTGSGTRALAVGTTPFLLQDLLKVVIVAVILYRGHLALRLRS